jgi:hypothetical protein
MGRLILVVTEPLQFIPPAAPLKVAVTVWLDPIVTVHNPVPEHAPDHPVNVEPVLGVAVNVTTVSGAKPKQPEPHGVP